MKFVIYVVDDHIDDLPQAPKDLSTPIYRNLARPTDALKRTS